MNRTFWNIKKRGVCMLAAGLLTAFLVLSCQEPVPLYGSWMDNGGNRITFVNDGTFVAAIVNKEDMTNKIYTGTYTVLQNSMSFSCPEEDLLIVTEWDLRGNMLYITWPNKGENVPLTLFKISN
jgi:hypothetical protein